MRRIGLAAMAAVLTLAPACAHAQRGDEGAEFFVRSLYPPVSERMGERPVWTPGLQALIDRDIELAGDDDIPWLNGDPLCDCQDWTGFRLEDVDIQRAPWGWTAVTAFTVGGEDKVVRLKLQGSPNDGWRIDDVIHPGGPSLAEELTRSNAEVEARRATAP